MTEYKLIISDINKLTSETIPFNFASPPIDPIQLANDLVKTMYEYNGVGLAANQVGIPYKVFCMRGMPENLVCFNPRIVTYSNETIELEEACLSFPGLIVKIKRPQHIRARFQLPNGETVTKQYTGMTARIFQHELDHLEGKLYYTRASRVTRDLAFKRMKKNVYAIKTNDSAIDAFLADTTAKYNYLQSKNS